MTIAHIYKTVREAWLWFEKEIRKTSPDSYHRIIGYPFYLTYNGDEHWFMAEKQYPAWSLGRDYMLNGKRYRSGYIVTREKNE